MAITLDAATGSTRTATTDPWTFSHAGGGSPVAALLAGSHGATATDKWGAVTYGGVTMTRRIDSTVSLAAGENGMTAIWELLAGVPSGTQTVSIDYTSFDDDDAVFAFVTLNAAGVLECIDSDRILNTSVANPSLTMQQTGRQAFSVGAVVNGVNSPGTITWANATIMASTDYGSSSGWALRQTSPSTSDTTFSATIANNGTSMVMAAYAEVPTFQPRHPGVNMQDPGVFAHRDDLWERVGRIFVPRLWEPRLA